MTTIESIQYRSLARGPRLIVLGAVHGNETCGTHGIRRVAAEFAAGSLALTCGTLTLVPIANPVAYARGQREGDDGDAARTHSRPPRTACARPRSCRR